MANKIYVLDFGSQYNQDIVKMVRSLEVHCELVDYDTDLETLKLAKGLILSGSPDHVYDKKSRKPDPKIYELGIPVLGICYGMQLLAEQFGGEVTRLNEMEEGLQALNTTKQTPLTEKLNDQELFHMAHFDVVTKLSENFESLGYTDMSPIAMMKHKDKDIYGVQFHPEVNDRPNGRILMNNFLENICEVEKDFSTENFINQQIEEIREQVKEDKVILALSGGVDSTVVAALLSKAIGKQLTCILVDHGLMRKNEIEQVKDSVLKNFDLNFVVIDAQDRFLKKLKRVTDPETKRKIIGKEFIDVFAEEAKKYDDAKWLAQGTIYSDVIESKKENIIKSHHNVGGLPEDLKFDLLEPVKYLFKDEVRKLGTALGLPDSFVHRQPFPGPGLGVRIIGEITRDKIRMVQEADYIVREEIAKNNLNIFQYFAIITPLQTVGIKNKKRSYKHVVAIRAVHSKDAMTADIAEIPYPVLKQISSRITAEVEGVNRVVYDITAKPPGSIEWE